LAENGQTDNADAGTSSKTSDSQVKQLKDMLTEQKQLLEGLLPASTTKGLGGDITVGDTFGYVAEQVAYHGINAIARDISRKIHNKLKPPNQPRILIVSDLNIARLSCPYFEVATTHNLYKAMMDDLQKRFETALAEYQNLLYRRTEVSDQTAFGVRRSPAAAAKFSEIEMAMASQFAPVALPIAAVLAAGLSAAPGVVSSMSDIAGQFRSDYTVKTRDVKFNIQSLISSAAGYLASEKIPVYVLNNYPLGEEDLEKGIMKKYENLFMVSRKILNDAALISDLLIKEKDAVDRLKAELKQLEDKMAGMSPGGTDFGKIDSEIFNKKYDIRVGEDWMVHGQALVKEQDTANTDLITAMKNFTAVQTGQEFSMFALATLWEKMIPHTITHILFLNIVSGGGEAITMKSVWKSGNTSYIGGLVVSYALETSEGEILLAGTCPSLHAFDYAITFERNNTIRPIPFKEEKEEKIQNPLDNIQ
jgi:hypothetical protein